MPPVKGLGVAKRPGAEHGEVVIKKSGGKHKHEEHGGAWKVAFADFCLALMCLFLVLWVLAARDKEQIEAAMAGGGAQNMTFQGAGERMIGEFQPGQLIPKEPIVPPKPQEKTGAEPDAKKLLDSPDELAELSRRIRKAGAQIGLTEHITTVVTAEGLRILLHDTDKQGMFRTGSAQVMPAFAQLLHRIGPMFQEIDNQLVIAGHTDGVPFQSTQVFGASNWSLSTDRALVARAHLLQGGMPAASVLQVIGMADAALFDAQQPMAAANRRVELLVTTKDHALQVQDTFGPLPERQLLAPDLESSVIDTPLLETLKEKLLRPLQDAATVAPTGAQ
jgi:chemotaxis protein MotB